MLQVESSAALSYRTIRRDYQPHRGIEPVLVDHYVKLISPLFTMLFVRAGVIPNVVTLLMMVSGIIGAVLFALPFMAAKIAGIIFIHLWYVLDCSDGEVARITKRFSKMGTEIDYTAHLVCHPLFNLAFAWGLISMHRYSAELILFVAVIGISAELLLRNLISLRSLFALKTGSSASPGNSAGWLTRTRRIITQAFSLYPNVALAFPILFILDLLFGTSLSFYCLIAQTCLSAIAVLRGYVFWMGKILRT